MPRVRKKAAVQPSVLSRAARKALARTAQARAAIDAAIDAAVDAAVVGVTVEGGPPELGPARELDIAEVARRYRERFA